MASATDDSYWDVLDILKNWTPASDVRAFKHSGALMVASTAVSAGYINYRFRRALKLRGFVFMTTYAATIFIPIVMSPIMHHMFVLKPMVMGTVGCPMCIETRSSLIQMSSAVLYPMVLSPLACLQYANSYMTYAVPSITQDGKNFLKMLYNITKPMKKPLMKLSIVNLALGAALSYWESSALHTVAEKINEMERKLPAEKVKKLKEKQLQDESKLDNLVENKDFTPRHALDTDD